MGYTERKRWLFFGLPFTFTKYTIEEEQITINRGFFTTTEDACYMYKVVDTKLEKSLIERIFGLGSVLCYTGGDVTDQVIRLNHIKHSKEIKDYIFINSEEMRKKRRTLNTQNISASYDDGELSDSDIDS